MSHPAADGLSESVRAFMRENPVPASFLSSLPTSPLPGGSEEKKTLGRSMCQSPKCSAAKTPLGDQRVECKICTAFFHADCATQACPICGAVVQDGRADFFSDDAPLFADPTGRMWAAESSGSSRRVTPVSFCNEDTEAPVYVHEDKVFIQLDDGSHRWLQASDDEILDTFELEWADGRLRVWGTGEPPSVRDKGMLLVDGVPWTYIDPENTLVSDPRGRIRHVGFHGSLQEVRLSGVSADVVATQTSGELYVTVDGARRWLAGGGRSRLTSDMVTCAFGELLLRDDDSFVRFPVPEKKALPVPEKKALPVPEKKAHPEEPLSVPSSEDPTPWEAAEIGDWGPLERQTIYLGAHGTRAAPDTFVPEGMTALFYADLDMALPQVYAQLALSGRFDPRRAGPDHEYGAGERIPNYLLTQISDAEQAMLRQGSLVPEEQWIFVGGGVIPDNIPLCTSPFTCWPDTSAPPPPEHHRDCRGLLATVRAREIYLTACRNWPGSTAVTSHVAGDRELPDVLVKFSDEIAAEIISSPDKGIPRFLALPPVSRSMILSSSVALAEYFDSLAKTVKPDQYRKMWATWENRAEENRVLEEFQSALAGLKLLQVNVRKIKAHGQERKLLRSLRKEIENGTRAAGELLAFVDLSSGWPKRWIRPGVPQGKARSAVFQSIMGNALQRAEELELFDARKETTDRQINSIRRALESMRDAARGVTQYAARQDK